VIRYQKGQTKLDFTEARDSEWQWHQLGYMQISALYVGVYSVFYFFTKVLMTLFCQTFLIVITHTHPFNGPLSGTTQVSRYQKGKTNLDFTEARQ